MKVIRNDIRRTRGLLTYEENVEILGAVRAGARLRVAGDVAICGSVEDADILAEGNVVVDGGFLGGGLGRIACGGDFSARFVQGQRIEAGGTVRVKTALLSATVFASGDVIVGEDDTDGSIVGGSVHAYGNVESTSLGSARPVMTRIDVGIDPVMALKIEQLERDAMDLTRRRIGFIKDLMFVSRDADSAHTETAVDMKAATDAIQGDIIAVGEEIMQLRKHATLNPEAGVVVRRVSYPPLEISICFSRIVNEADTGPVTFRLFDDRIILDTWSLE